MSRSEEGQPEVVVARNDWERFLASVERLISLHQRTLQKLRELRNRNRVLRTELRSAMALPTIREKPQAGGPETERIVTVRQCRYCGQEIEMSAKFCDRCGRTVAVSLCECGRELVAMDKYCDRCGRPVNPLSRS